MSRGDVTLFEVLYGPSLVVSSLSVKRCVAKKCSVLFYAVTQKVTMYNSTGVLYEAVPSNGLLVLQTGLVTSNEQHEHVANLSIDPFFLP